MVTPKQNKLLLFIQDYTYRNQGESPSYDQMKLAMGLQSKSGIHRMIIALEERGYLRRLPNKARSIEISKLPQDAVFKPRLSKFELPSERSESAHNTTFDQSVVLYGKIAAGTPIEALSNEVNHIDVPKNFSDKDRFYALEVSGDSMINAGILDQDIVIIERTNYAPHGAIAVALVQGEEATLKYYKNCLGKVFLEAANPKYPTIEYNESEVTVQGVLAAVIRSYNYRTK